jgi:iron complex transport system substrate-binding protein
MLYGLGLGERVVAVSHECDYPAEALARPRVTRTHIAVQAASRQIDDQVRQSVEQGLPLYGLDIEQLAALRPDLIVTQAQCDVCAVRYQDVLSAVRDHPSLAGCQVFALNPQSIGDVLDDIRRLGRAAGCEHAAEAYVAGLEARIGAVRCRTSALSATERPRVACIEWIEPLMISGNWMPELLDIAGGQCDLTAAGKHSPYVAWQDVRSFDPEVIVIMPCGFDLQRTLTEVAALGRLPGWMELTAVRRRRVYAVDGNAYFNRSGPRLVDSLEILAHLIHPEQFASPQLADRERVWTQWPA